MSPSALGRAISARLFIALVLAVPLAAGAGPTLVTHEFTNSAEEWRISTDSGETDPIFNPTGGSPGACVGGIDEALGETWYFRAPAGVLRQLSAAENGTISFSLKQSTNVDGGFLDDDIVIVGAAGRIGYRFGSGSAPGMRWKDFSVRLSANEGWTWNWGSRATQAQIRSVLAAPLSLEIRGEYVAGEDEGSLDNFTLKAAPTEPA